QSRHVARIDHDVRLEVEHLLQLPQRDVEQVTDAAGQAFEKPDVRARAGEIDMTQPLAPYFRLSYFDPALIADHAAVLHPFVFAAETLPIRYGAEDARAEESVALRFEGPVVDCFGLGHLTMRPLPDFFR